MPENIVRILLVEDNSVDALLVEEAFLEAGLSSYRLTHVQRLEAAIQALKDDSFDAALLDLGLPDSQGLDTFLKFQRHSKSLPVIILSGLDDEELAVRSVQEGAQDYLLKGSFLSQLLLRGIRFAIERRRTSERMTASEASYRRLFETSRDGIFILDADTGQVTDVNPQMEVLLGFPISDFIGKRLWEIAPFFQGRASEAAFQTLRVKDHIRFDEISLLRHDGSTLVAEFVSNIYLVGTTRVIQCTIRDISERIRIAKALRESEADFRTLAESMPQIVWVTKPDGWNIYFNQRWTDYTGLSPEESSGFGWVKPFHADGKEGAQKAWQDATDGKSRYSLESQLRGRDGAYRWWLVQAVPMTDATGTILKWFGTCTDIHDSKLAELEKARTAEEIRTLNAVLEERVSQRTADLLLATKEAEEANRSKSEFLSRMSHELRTPLNAILGFGQILNQEELQPLAKESIGHILKGGRHLLGLINEVLDLARVEAGGLELSMEPVSIAEAARDACSLIRPLAEERGIQLIKVVNSVAATHVLADAQRLKQVLINLLSNGIKYNRSCGTVEVTWSSPVDGRVLISVRDTGPGIRPEDMARLFQPFERLGFGNSIVEGTGLGLTISQRLMAAMGGRVIAESTMGVGSTFSVELASVEAPQLEIEAPAVEDAHSLEKVTPEYTILAIEDNLSNLRLLEMILARKPGITLLSAMQGSVGLDLARQFQPDLILLDMNLPDMTGPQVLAALRAAEVTKETPIVIVSADATPSRAERILLLGASHYLTKPLNVSEFLRVVERFLPERQLIEALETSGKSA